MRTAHRGAAGLGAAGRAAIAAGAVAAVAVTAGWLPATAQVPPIPIPIPTTLFTTTLFTTTTTEEPGPSTTAPPAPPPPPTTSSTVAAPPDPAAAPAGEPVVEPAPGAAPEPPLRDPAAPPPVAPPAGTASPPPPVSPLPMTPAAVTGSYGLGVAGTLGSTLLLIALASQARPGGHLMSRTRRTRLLLGVALLAAAAVVGLVGYLRLSLEPAVNRQIPYLASAGMALVLLAVTGGSLIVAEQLSRDDRRIEELEAAVRTLAGALAPSIEAPPRRGLTALVEPAPTDMDRAEPPAGPEGRP